MALSTYALVSVQEFKEYMPVSGDGNDPLIESVINSVSDRIEQYLDRQIVTRGNLTEWHTMQVDGVWVQSQTLRVGEWPIISVTSVHEDTEWPRTYGAAALLVVNTDYQIVAGKGILRRISATGPLDWASGWLAGSGGSLSGSRAIQVIYSGGYANTAAVPARIKAVALRFAANCYAEATRGQHGVVAQSDATGNFTRFGPASLTKDMKAELYDERRLMASVTWERAA